MPGLLVEKCPQALTVHPVAGLKLSIALVPAMEWSPLRSVEWFGQALTAVSGLNSTGQKQCDDPRLGLTQALPHSLATDGGPSPRAAPGPRFGRG